MESIELGILEERVEPSNPWYEHREMLTVIARKTLDFWWVDFRDARYGQLLLQGRRPYCTAMEALMSVGQEINPARMCWRRKRKAIQACRLAN